MKPITIYFFFILTLVVHFIFALIELIVSAANYAFYFALGVAEILITYLAEMCGLCPVDMEIINDRVKNIIRTMEEVED
jgi:hypothetical protein